MRIWSIHPKYLDSKGLVALWRECLLAQKVLLGETKGYKNHPQLNRFKQQTHPLKWIGSYLDFIFQESMARGYNFDSSKIVDRLPPSSKLKMKVTSKQIEFEFMHLKSKLRHRSPPNFDTLNAVRRIQTHAIFKRISGEIESWEIQ